MKIAHVETGIILVPIDEPLADMPESKDAVRPTVYLRLRTDTGIEGIGITFYAEALTKALREAVAAMGELITGMDPQRPEAIIARIEGNALGSGPAGIFTLALAAIDMAVWDIRAKALDMPLWKLLGGARARVPTYASGALRRGLTDDQAALAAERLKAKGFREMKMQLALPGHTNPAIEERRARVVRAAAGPETILYCDINQRWRPEQAINIGRRIEDVRLDWLEDVTTCDDFAGLARVTQALSTPIAGGEYLWGIAPHAHAIEHHSVDIVMVDMLRAGGVTPWMKIAHMAQAFNLPIVSHVVPEFMCHLVAAAPNGLTVEYMPWMLKLFQETPKVENGELILPERPGFGLAFDEQTLRRFMA
jgi:L-alanine-DL-glutamate epimerase-like enolase superfamily enzyme